MAEHGPDGGAGEAVETRLVAGQTWVPAHTGKHKRVILQIFPGSPDGRLVRFAVPRANLLQTEAQFRAWMRKTGAYWKEARHAR